MLDLQFKALPDVSEITGLNSVGLNSEWPKEQCLHLEGKNLARSSQMPHRELIAIMSITKMDFIVYFAGALVNHTLVGAMGANPVRLIVPVKEKTVILFMEKTWLFWWMLAAFLVLRWFHVLCVRAKVEHSDVAQVDFGVASQGNACSDDI